MTEGCGGCKFWESVADWTQMSEDRHLGDDDRFNECSEIGRCRRYPPAFIGYTDTGALGIPAPSGNASDFFAFPVVDMLEWCGEYKPKP